MIAPFISWRGAAALLATFVAMRLLGLVDWPWWFFAIPFVIALLLLGLFIGIIEVAARELHR